MVIPLPSRSARQKQEEEEEEEEEDEEHHTDRRNHHRRVVVVFMVWKDRSAAGNILLCVTQRWRRTSKTVGGGLPVFLFQKRIYHDANKS